MPRKKKVKEEELEIVDKKIKKKTKKESEEILEEVIEKPKDENIEESKEVEEETKPVMVQKEEIIEVREGNKTKKFKFYKNIEQYLADIDLPEWKNEVTPLDEVNLKKVNTEIRSKYDDVELDIANKTLAFKSDKQNKKVVDLKPIIPGIPEGGLTTEQVNNVNKIPGITSQLEKIEDEIKGKTNVDLTGLLNINSNYQNGEQPKGGYLSIIDDDNAKQVWTILKPMSEELGVAFCVAVPSNDIKVNTGGSMTPSQLRELQNNLGWEVLGHTVTHENLGTQTYSEQLMQLKDNKEKLTSWGLEVKGLCYPYGSHNSDTMDIMSQYYMYGFNGGQGNSYNTVDNFENYLIYRMGIGSYAPQGGGLEYYKNKIDEVVENNGWLVLMTHCSDPSHTESSTALLKQVIQYAQSKNMNISTPNKIFNRFKNILEIKNKLKIKCTGEIDEIANLNKVSVICDNTKTSEDLLTGFKNNTITYTMCFKRDAGNTKLPDNGTLETVNYSKTSGLDIKDFTFRHQKLYGLNGDIWYRQPLSHNNWTWGEWRSILSKTNRIISEKINMSGQTIPPNSTLRVPIELANKSSVNNDSVIVINPNGGIEDGIGYNVDVWGVNNFGIRLCNNSTSAKNTASRAWNVKILN